MKVITLDAQLEREMVASLSKGENGLYLALNPEMLQHVIRQLAEQIKKVQWFITEPGDPDFTGYADSFLPSGRTLLS